MAKKPAATAPEPEEIEIIESGAQISDALARLYAEHGIADIEAKAHVYFINAETGADEKIWSGPPDDYDLDTLAKKHGSGQYRLMVYVKTDAGNFGRKINTIQSYRLSAEEESRLRAIRKGDIVPTSAAPNAQPAITAETLAMALATALKAVMPAQAAPINNLGMLKEVAEIVRTLAPISQPPQQGRDPLDFLRLGVSLAQARAGGDGEGDDAPRRGATSTDLFMRLIDKFGPALVNAAQQGTLQPDGAQPQQIVQAAPPGAQPQEDDPMMRLQMGLSFLLMQARANNDPEIYADVVLDNVPADDLKKFVNGSDPITYLASLNAEVRQHEKWFRDLIAEVKAAILEAGQPEGDSGQPPKDEVKA